MKELNKEYFENNLDHILKKLSKTLSEEEINKGVKIIRLNDNKHDNYSISFHVENTINKVLGILYSKEQIEDLKSVVVLQECLYYADDEDVKITVQYLPISPYDDDEFIVFEYDTEYVYLNICTKKFSFEDKK